MMRAKKDWGICVFCGNTLTTYHKSMTCNNTCRSAYTKQKDEIAKEYKEFIKEKNKPSGRVCKQCGRKVDNKNYFFCSVCLKGKDDGRWEG